ncbi:MAG: hypothetical protein ACXVBW_12140 [Bdellovibrionota bacterium]
MARCPAEKLTDLEPVFAQIRTWEGIREPQPGIFYFKRIPFLHFHEKLGRRWADVKLGKTWGPELAIPLASTISQRNAFLKSVRKRFEVLVRK